MAKQKTRLMRADRYGLLKAAELAAEMIGCYERRLDGAATMRVECPDEENWDDIEVTHPTNIDRWQVKRLTQGLAMADVQALIATAAQGSGARRILGVAALVPVLDGTKQVCHLRDLENLCADARKPGTDPTLFAKNEKRNPTFKLVRAASGPSTTDASVLATLKSLHVRELGLEETLLQRAQEHLKHVFANADEVVKRICNWFVNHPDGTIVVDIALLYGQVVDGFANRIPGHPRWIYLSRNPVAATWASRGPLLHEQLVEATWRSGPARVELGVRPRPRESVSAAVTRLAIHRVGSTSVEASSADASAWNAHAVELCGGTLGRNDTLPRHACDASTSLSVPPHAPQAELDTPTLAAQLHGAMDAHVWAALIDAVDRRLQTDSLETQLRSLMRTRWTEWHKTLCSDAGRRANFFRSLLVTAEEWRRPGFDASVRTGPELVEEMARAVLVALAVAAACDGSSLSIEVGLPGSINNLVFGSVQAHVVALSAASHPDDRKPYSLSNAAGPMLAAETGIAILACVEASAADLFEVAFAETLPYHVPDVASESFRHAGAPPPMLTANPTFVAALSKGIDALRKHLGAVLGRMNDLRLASLQEAVAGGPNG
jgi:hypothetical protein